MLIWSISTTEILKKKKKNSVFLLYFTIEEEPNLIQQLFNF